MSIPSMMNIPVLTEVITPSPAKEAPAEKQAVRLMQEQAATVANLEDFLNSKREWDDLERRLTQRILQSAQERIGFILAHAIKDSLAAVLHKATEELAAEIRLDLQNTLEVVVSHAVTQEISRLQQQGSGNLADNVRVKGGDSGKT